MCLNPIGTLLSLLFVIWSTMCLLLFFAMRYHFLSSFLLYNLFFLTHGVFGCTCFVHHLGHLWIKWHHVQQSMSLLVTPILRRDMSDIIRLIARLWFLHMLHFLRNNCSFLSHIVTTTKASLSMSQLIVHMFLLWVHFHHHHLHHPHHCHLHHLCHLYRFSFTLIVGFIILRQAHCPLLMLPLLRTTSLLSFVRANTFVLYIIFFCLFLSFSSATLQVCLFSLLFS